MATDLHLGIRDVSDEEVEFYEEHGWVMLPGLFPRDLVDELLRASRRVLREEGPAEETRRGLTWQRGRLAVDGVQPFRTIAFGPELGRVAQRLINRRRLCGVDQPVRFHSDSIIYKGPGAGATQSHQDSAYHGPDRIGEFNMWVALEEVTPEMGAMRFLTGSHREGPLGNPFPNLGPDGRHDPERWEQLRNRETDWLREHYPRLWDLYEPSPPFHYQPGDTTVHKGYMIHSAPPNVTDRERWSWIPEYMPADTRVIDGGAMHQMVLPLDPAKNPIVYPVDR